MRYFTERDTVVLSVGELCGLAFRTGDLDLRSGGRAGTDRLAKGREVHRLLQSRAGADYEAEVTLTDVTLFEGIRYEVTGRADGILYGDCPTVEEIKSVGARAFDVPPSERHRAQAMCYAYFLSRANALREVRIRLTLLRIDDGEVRNFDECYSSGALERYYTGLLARVSYRAQILADRGKKRLPSVNTGKFPYSRVREGQDIMLRECYRDIKSGKRLFVQAPTGTGKTVSALYPAVRALGEGYCDKIFYLTAKNSTAREAYRAAADIFRAGSHLRTVSLTSREQLCQNQSAKNDPAGISQHCNPEDCPYAKGFYDRCGKAVCEILAGQNGYPRKVFSDAAQTYGICPYELQLELSEFCDIVICDYNYVFDPAVYLRRYFDPEREENRQKYVFLIDEAHNLADRACAMYSAELKESELENLSALLTAQFPDRAERIRPLDTFIAETKALRDLCGEELTYDESGKAHGFYRNPVAMESYNRMAEDCLASLDKWAFAYRDQGCPPELATVSSALKRYVTVAELYDGHFTTFIERDGEELNVRQICLDPSGILDGLLKKACASVLFSATLTPTDYFADILGGGKGAVRIALPSPFDPDRLCVTAVTGVSTRYEDREKSVRKLAGIIAASVSAKNGNYIVYFPSYDYMKTVYDAFRKRYPEVETVLQERGMSADRREDFLNAFAEDERLRVGFCVLGGSFSEGVDLPGKRLIGAVIVGVGLPGISNERNILRDYYESTRECGYDYAYTYPGMNRVLQAAGRVIRREDDRGIIVLADDRYAVPRYRALLPEHWQNLQCAGNASELAEIAGFFWKKQMSK